MLKHSIGTSGIVLKWHLRALGYLAFAGLLVCTGQPVFAQKEKDKVPPGQPFQALQRQIDQLRAELEAGVFTVLRVNNPDPSQGSTLFFGPTDLCNLGIDPPGGFSGLIERDPVGFRLLGRNDQGCRLIFGPTMDCTVEVDPQGPEGLLLRDPGGIRVLNPLGDQPSRLLFGPTNECTVSVDPMGPEGLLLRDPGGVRILNPNPQLDPSLAFGPTNDCRIRAGEIGVDDQGQFLFGLILEDPGAVAIRNPIAGGRSTLAFGDDPRCQISVLPGDGFGMIFTDPERFLFDNSMIIEGDLVVEGEIFAGGPVAAASSRRWKENVRTIDDALDKVDHLRGVYFDWKQDHGGQADVGFIAEEVAEVLPEAVVFEEDGTNVKGVKYANLVAVAVEGIKEQQKQIERLQDENAALRSDLVSLKRQMEDLSARVSNRDHVVAATPNIAVHNRD